MVQSTSWDSTKAAIFVFFSFITYLKAKFTNLVILNLIIHALWS